MTFLQRFRTPFAERAGDDDRARTQAAARRVGELLQERREDLGLDLDEIGVMLRIKPAYLAALEQGRTRDLPGPAYAIGFIRAYADFLGLDAEHVLTRFKAEAAAATARPDLALPVPLGERSLPGGALVLVALIVALCGYGIWYYLSTEERDRPERVAAVPESLQTPPVAPALVAPPGSAAATSAAESPPLAVRPNALGAIAGDGNAADASPTLSAINRVAPAKPGPPGLAAQGEPAPRPASPGPPAPGPAPRMTAAGGTAQPAPASPASPAPPAQTAAATPPAAGAPPQVAIRALSNCWIQVRGPDQAIVFSRVLKTGEVYKVPPRPGLSLRTGNAGALEITVDGKPAPSIGGIGKLRRDVALDPEELAAGTAVHG